MRFIRRETYPNNLLSINHRLKTSPILIIFYARIFYSEILNVAKFPKASKPLKGNRISRAGPTC